MHRSTAHMVYVRGYLRAQKRISQTIPGKVFLLVARGGQTPGQNHRKANTMSHDKIKAAIRRRMTTTGEPYLAARREVIRRRGESSRGTSPSSADPFVDRIPDLSKLIQSIVPNVGKLAQMIAPDTGKLAQSMIRAAMPDTGKLGLSAMQAALPDTGKLAQSMIRAAMPDTGKLGLSAMQAALPDTGKLAQSMIRAAMPDTGKLGQVLPPSFPPSSS
jgi:hypothetical protein